MKAKALTITAITLLTIGITLAALFTPATALLKATVKFKPNKYVYSHPLPSPYWNSTIYRVDPAQIDPATISLTGQTAGRTIYPVAYQIIFAGRDHFIACFDPNDMKALFGDILIFHYWYGVPGRYTLFLVLSGNLYDGTAFQGTGKIVVTVP